MRLSLETSQVKAHCIENVEIRDSRLINKFDMRTMQEAEQVIGYRLDKNEGDSNGFLQEYRNSTIKGR